MSDDIWSAFSDALKIRQEEDTKSDPTENSTHALRRNSMLVGISNENPSDITRHIRCQKNKVDVCSACGESLNGQVSDGFVVCSNCGLVKDFYIDSNAEWRCFNNAMGGKDTSGVRCGEPAPILLPGTQLNTFVGGKDKRVQRVHQWNNLTPRERNMLQIYKEFEEIGHENNLSKHVINAATNLYNRLYTEMENKNYGVKRCNVRQGLKAACLYYACKQMKTPRERKEIAEMMGNTTRIVTKGCNSFLDIMGKEYIRMEPFQPEDFVARFSCLLGLSYPMQRRLKVIVEFVATLEELADNTPTSITSACIYFLSCKYDLRITKEMIHNACGSSQIIISKTFAKISPHQNEILERLLPLDCRE